jgi:hypothetical protein
VPGPAIRILPLVIDRDEILFQAQTPLGFAVRVTRQRWLLISESKHPVMAGRETVVRRVLEAPDEIRQSRSDSRVLLFYKGDAPKRWTCAVAKRADDDGLLITAYPTDAIKEGVRVWPK